MMLELPFALWFWLMVNLGQFGVDIATCEVVSRDEMHIEIVCQTPDGEPFPVVIDLQGQDDGHKSSSRKARQQAPATRRPARARKK